MDNEFGLDLREIVSNLETAEVISIYFPLLAKTLVIDMRYDHENEPLVRVMAMVNSVEERFRSLRELRPKFRRPESVTLVPWPKYVDALVRLGLWDRLLNRLQAGGFQQSMREADTALEDLRRLERATVRSAIKGEGFQTIWVRKED